MSTKDTDAKTTEGTWKPTLGDALKALEATKTLLSNPEGVAATRRNALNDTIGGTIVDTVKAFDTGLWETGIEVDGKPWVIVEQYPNEAAARTGHQKYVDEVKAGKKTFTNTQAEGTFEW